MNVRTLVAAFAVAALALVACGEDTADDVVDIGDEADVGDEIDRDDLTQEALEDAAGHEGTVAVALEPAEGWEEADEELVGEEVAAAATVYINEAACAEGFCDNLNTMVTPAQTDDLDLFHEGTLQQVEQSLGAELLAEEPVDVDGHAGYEVEYQEDDAPQGDLHYLQRYTLVGDEAVIVTFTARQDSFETWRDDAEAMLDSIAISVEG